MAGQSQFPDYANHWALSGAAATAEIGELVPSQLKLELWHYPVMDAVDMNWTDLNDESVRVTIVNAQGVVVQRQKVKSLFFNMVGIRALPDEVYHISLQASKLINYTGLIMRH